MLDTKRQQDIDPRYKFDTQLPEKRSKLNKNDISLMSSTGVLAPESLK